MEKLIQILTAELEAAGSKRTAAAYRSAWRSVNRELNGRFKDREIFTPKALRLYEQRMKNRGLRPSTISFYMRMLRAIYNKGVARGLCIEKPKLFAHVYTGIGKSIKRAVDPAIFGQLQRMDMSSQPELACCRDMFVLSYALQGIAFVDLANLRKADLRNGMLSYQRKKTGTQICVPVTNWAMNMINKYSEQAKGSAYLLPILCGTEAEGEAKYENSLRAHNRRLSRIVEKAKIKEHLTSYTARHTYATTAHREHIPIAIISQAMGHRTEEITHTYLAEFDQHVLLAVNQMALMKAGVIDDADSEMVMDISAINKYVRHLAGDGQF